MPDIPIKYVNKIAEVTVFFWLMKIVATTLGETTGDFIAQTLNLGYVVGLAITFTLLIVVLFFQISSKTFHSPLFWIAIVATTTAGTEISDLMDRTLNVGYLWGSVILAACLLGALLLWYKREGNVNVDPIEGKSAEVMFWLAVVFSNSLGTAFGDYLVDGLGLSYFFGSFVTMGVIAVVVLLHYFTKVNAAILFWTAFVFTRPFGATFGDFLTKPAIKGGLDLGTYNASLIAVGLLGLLMFFSLRQRRKAGVR